MSESHESLKEYRDRMDLPIEILGITLAEFGWKGEGMDDHEIVEIATRKLRTLHTMVLATKFNPEMLKAIMAE